MGGYSLQRRNDIFLIGRYVLYYLREGIIYFEVKSAAVIIFSNNY